MKVIHIKKPFRKTYTLQIDKEGSLIVRTNASVTTSGVNKIIERHKSWIEKSLEKFALQQASIKKFEIKENNNISLLDENFIIKFKESFSKRIKVYIHNNEIIFQGNSLKTLDQCDLKNVFIKFLKEAFKEFVIAKSFYYSKLYGFEFNNISIKDHRSKWGSCSSMRNLNFDWKLILTPKNIAEYVIIHEICHLKEMNHSSRFWNLVKIQCHDYKLCRKWLRINGNQIKNFF